MNKQNNFQERIEYQGDLRPVFEGVCQKYALGNFISFDVIRSGYEDFNIRLKSSKGNFFVKIFAKFRKKWECLRYIQIINRAYLSGINFPEIFKTSYGFLYEKQYQEIMVRLCTMQYIEGRSFLELGIAPSFKQTKSIVEQATRINKLKIKPKFIYDSWATINVLKEYEKKKKHLSNKDLKIITPLIKKFKKLSIKSLPHCFVHGDINKANVLKDKKGKIFIIDFSVSNYSPRIIELAVLLSAMFFSKKEKREFENDYKFILNHYLKFIQLTEKEILLLPFFTTLSFTAYLLAAEYEKKAKRNHSEENNYWLVEAREGLQYTSQLWKNLLE